MTIAEQITVYGVFPVAFALVAALLFLMFRSNKKNSNDQQQLISKLMSDQQQANNNMQKQFLSVAQQLLQNTNPRHSAEEEDNNRKTNLLINMQLQKIQLHTNANRVSCFLYHNGGRDILGRSFQKMSMTHETIDSNTVSVMSSYQNIPRMMFPVLVQKLSDEGYYDITDIENIKEVDAITYQSLYTRGVKSAFFRAIKTTDHITLGFVLIEFTTNACGDIEDLKRCLSNKAIKISGALEVEDNSNLFKKGEIQ